MDHKREHRTPPPLARVMGVGRQQQQHDPINNTYVMDRILNERMTDNILALNAIRRKNELIRRKSYSINFNM